MSLLNKQINTNLLEMNLIAKANDMSYTAFNGERQPLRGQLANITPLGQVPFKPPTDIITREMIQEYHDNLQNKAPYVDELGDQYKYFPSGNTLTDTMLEQPKFINAPVLGRPATETDIEDLETDKIKEISKIDDIERLIEDTKIKYIDAKELYEKASGEKEKLIKKLDINKQKEAEQQAIVKASDDKIKDEEKVLDALKIEIADPSIDPKVKKQKEKEARGLEKKIEHFKKTMKKEHDELLKIRITIIGVEGDVKKNQTSIDDLVIDMKDLENKTQTLYIDHKRFNDVIKDIDATKDIYLKNIDENKVEESRVKRENKNNIYKYAESLQLANRNRLSVQKDIQETDEDYLKRLNQIEAEKFDTSLYKDKVDLAQVKLLKDNLMHITRDTSLIENVVKSFQVEDKFNINKHFTMIKKILLEAYGFNNKNITSNDIVGAIKAYFFKLENPFEDVSIEAEPIVSAVVLDKTEGNLIIRVNDNSLYIENTTAKKHIYLKVGRGSGKDYVLFSKTLNEKDHFKNIQGREKDTIIDLLYRYLSLTEKNIETIFDTQIRYIKDLYEVLKAKYSLEPVNANVKRMSGHSIIGYGLNLNNQDETNKLKEKLQIIEGEIQAGNDNVSLIRELKEVLKKMINVNLITPANAKKYFNQFI